LVLNGGLSSLEVKLPSPLPGAGPWRKVWSSAWETPAEPPANVVTPNIAGGDEPDTNTMTRTIQIPVVQPGGQIIREPLLVAVSEPEDESGAGTHPDVVRLLELNVQVFVAHR